MNADEIVKKLRRAEQYCLNEYSTMAKQAADLIESLQAQTKVTGETSDGYHTFNELYHHRAVLFSVICNDRPDVSWKSKLHHDGTMFDGMFIVGIQTPEGQATYHYDIDPYWDMFRVLELTQAPEWDGHTPEQAIERIGNLPSMHTSLSASQRREKAAVGDLTKLATKPITPCHSCAKTCVFPASLAPECQPPTWCREWQWRGPQEAEKGEAE